MGDFYVYINNQTTHMKNLVILSLMSLFFLAAQKKVETLDFFVNGVENGVIVNNGYGSMRLNLLVDFNNSTESIHEQVKLSISGLPQNLYYDTSWKHSGYPPYHAKLFVHGDPGALVQPGTYFVNVLATSEHNVTKTYRFSIKIPYPPSCTGKLLGKYYNCHTYCTDQAYEDSVYADPVVINKIWFTNFNNTGQQAYGVFDCYTNALTIPQQLIGKTIYSGGYLIMYEHRLNIPINLGDQQCVIDMY
jgi:hypothetical protein